jgi:integrase
VSAGSIRKDPQRGTWYFVIDTSQGGKRRQVKRRGFTSRAEAQRELDKVRGVAPTGRAHRPDRSTLAVYLTERWLPTLEASPRLKVTSIAGYSNAAKHLVRHLGRKRLDQLAPDDFTRLYATLRRSGGRHGQGLSERSVRYVHVTARKALGDAVRWRLLGFNPVSEADPPAQQQPKPRAWTPAEVAAFLVAAEQDRWWPLWLTAATTGMRRGELAGLRWENLDLDKATLVVTHNRVVLGHAVVEYDTKNRKARTISLDASTVEALRAWRRAQREERLYIGPTWLNADGRVFVWQDGSPLHPALITRTFRRIADSAELPPLTLHGLRHSWATSALRAGVRTKVVSDRLGHASTRITDDIYTAHVDELDAEAANAVAGLYRQGRADSVTTL